MKASINFRPRGTSGRSRAFVAVAALVAVTLVSCSGAQDAMDRTDSSSDGFPVTVAVPGGGEVTVDKKPQRIAVLSTDAAIALHQLGATDRLVAVPQSVVNETLNPYAEEMAQVEGRLSGDTNPEPEQVLGYTPDLVVVTSRHGGEKSASAAMAKAGVPVLTLGNGWSSTDNVVDNLMAIGEATGTQDKAKALSQEITDGVANVETTAKESTNKGTAPSVAVLSNQGRTPFVNAGQSLVTDLVHTAGGLNAADATGIKQTQPIQPEQLVDMDPDRIMLVDVTGKGRSSFDALLKNPAVAELSAVKEGHVKMYKGREVYALAGIEVVTACEELVTWLHPGTSN